MTSAFSWQNSISLCPDSFCTPMPNLPVTPVVSWLPTFEFQSPIMKRTFFFWVLILEGPIGLHQLCSVRLLSRICLFVTPGICSKQGLPVHHQLPEFMQTHVHQLGDAIQPSHPLSPLLLLPPIPPSIRVFSNQSTLHMRWPKYWSFSLSISLSNEHPWIVSFRKDWLDLLAVQRTLKSLLQHHSTKASILPC